MSHISQPQVGRLRPMWTGLVACGLILAAVMARADSKSLPVLSDSFELSQTADMFDAGDYNYPGRGRGWSCGRGGYPRTDWTQGRDWTQDPGRSFRGDMSRRGDWSNESGAEFEELPPPDPQPVAPPPEFRGRDYRGGYRSNYAPTDEDEGPPVQPRRRNRVDQYRSWSDFPAEPQYWGREERPSRQMYKPVQPGYRQEVPYQPDYGFGSPIQQMRYPDQSSRAPVSQEKITRRYQDPSVIQFIATLPPERGLALYAEVLQLIQTRHLQPPKPGVLVQQGVTNLLAALEVPAFAQANRLQLHPQQVAQFRTAVSQMMQQSRISRVEDAVQAAQYVIQAGQQSLGLAPSTALVEMTYGAVESLDQFSAFVTPDAGRAMIQQLGMAADRTSRTETKEAAMPHKQSVTGTQMLEAQSGIGYLKLQSFTQSSAAEIKQSILALHQQGMRGLIVDLRGDPGGLLTAAIQVANEFLPGGLIVSTRGRTADDNMTERANGQRAFKVPLVIVIDEDSASASEILAAAIQENGRGVIVGRRSYGKGTVQTLFPLKAVGAGLRLTTAKFYSPRGREMAGAGVEPDVKVENAGRSGANGLDRDLQAAVQVVRQQMTGASAPATSAPRRASPAPYAPARGYDRPNYRSNYDF